MKWFSTHKTFTVITAIFAVLLILLSASVALRDNPGPVGRVANTVITTVQKPFVAFGNFAGRHIPFLMSDKKLTDENKKLKKELDATQKELILARLSEEDLKSLEDLSAALNPDGAVVQHRLVAADIISFEGSQVFNIFIINVGTEAGVAHNTVVVAGKGLVGRVVEVGDKWAKVVSIIGENNKVGFMVGKDSKYIGILNGDGKGNLVGTLLDADAKVKKGDSIYTSGIGGIYPVGVLIGKVTKADTTEENTLIEVKVKPEVYFKGLRKVAVLL
jgi:rod shape-determining protein MreC